MDLSALLMIAVLNGTSQSDIKPEFRLPKSSEVVSLEAEVFSVPGLLDAKYPRIRSFVIPRSRYDEVLRYFTPAAIAQERTNLVQLGSVLIVTKKRAFRLPFYTNHGDKGPLFFSVSGKVHVGNRKTRLDNANSLDFTIRVIYEELTGHTVTQPKGCSRASNGNSAVRRASG